jgi:L-rhamnose isomerase
MPDHNVESAFIYATGLYAELGVDTRSAIETLETISISMHCWQGDDVGGFESSGAELEGGGIAVTGNYPGRARTIEQLRSDLEIAYSLIPGNHRLNLHAIYGDFGGKQIERDSIGSEHFASWADWAIEQKLTGLDFNPTFFSHPLAESGFTLSSRDEKTRRFWIEHGKRCREIAAWLGKQLASPSVNNLWIPDGSKDENVSRRKHRDLLLKSLDQIYSAQIDKQYLKDSVESKLFGIGSESYVVGSHEFYLCWALKNNAMPCLDTGHFHPTESVADKISAITLFFDELLLHLSRGVRWDSDHVLTFNDEVKAIACEILRAGILDRTNIALDFFDATINRVAAWVIGMRAALKAFLFALLEPTDALRNLEQQGDYTTRLALLENIKTMPLGAVWDYYCVGQGVALDKDWSAEVREYEKTVQSLRD